MSPKAGTDRPDLNEHPLITDAGLDVKLADAGQPIRRHLLVVRLIQVHGDSHRQIPPSSMPGLLQPGDEFIE